MSGKFHTSWGEFGGFKHPDALRFEAASMVAYGAACNFGDQLHPSGEIDLDTYRNIGAAFAYVERIEQYGIGGRPAARLGLWRSGSDDDDEGVSSMLLETQTDYRVVADDDDLSGFDAIVLPGGRFLTAAEARRLDDFAGGLLILGAGGLLAGEDRFALDAGVEYLGPGRYDVDYLCAEDLVPLHEVPLQLTVPEEVASATLVPQRTALEVQRSGGSVAVTVPEVHCHQAVVFSY